MLLPFPPTSLVLLLCISQRIISSLPSPQTFNTSSPMLTFSWRLVSYFRETMQAKRRDLSYLICHLSAFLFPWTTRNVEMYYERFILPPSWGSQSIYFHTSFHSFFFFPASSISPSYTRLFPSSIKILRKKFKTSKNPTSLSNDLIVSYSPNSKFSKVLPVFFHFSNSALPFSFTVTPFRFPSYFTSKKHLAWL